MSIRIIIADDHRILRQGLRSLLEKETDMEVIAEAEDGQMAVRLAQEISPNLVIVDIVMPVLNGIDATRRIIAEAPRIKVLALSMYSNRRFVREMLRVGASGYLLKDCAAEELVNAIRTVINNQTYLSPKIADIMVRDYVHRLEEPASSVFSVLTNREREVLQLLSEGISVKEIAHHLALSMKTVETYRKQIMDKLDIHSIAELTKYAIREGLTSSHI